MSIQVEYATMAAVARMQKVLRSKLATVIATRPTDTSGFFEDMDADGFLQHLPTPSIRVAPENAVPYTVNDDAVVFVYHKNDRAPGTRNTGGPTYYVEQGSKITLGVYVRVLNSDGDAVSPREWGTLSGGSMTGREENYYRAELYAGAVWYALEKWGQGDGTFYDIEKTATETGEDSVPQPHIYARVEFEITQDLQIPVNTYDLT
jgi:hypothetical protein